MELIVHRGGLQTTVQDLGRRGHRAAGVPLSGAMDPFALRVANSLVGNAEGLAALEFTLRGPRLEFTEDALIAVGGAEVEGVRSWMPWKVRAGDSLDLGACRKGCRGYVAVSGGIDVEEVLGSRSTYLKGGWGGFLGRALHDGDRLKVGSPRLNPQAIPTWRQSWQINPHLIPAYSTSPVIRVIRARDAMGWSDPLFTTEFKVSPQSDRMGLRLQGTSLPGSGGQTLLSSAVVPGTVQVPPDGQPLVLMADAQTIGGYPQAAHVIGVDLPLVAQLRAGDLLRFSEVLIEEAHRVALVRDRAVAILREGLVEKLIGSGRGTAP